MEPWVDEAADYLEKITRDPLAGAIHGEVVVVSASERAARGRYQECQVEVDVESAEGAHGRVSTSVVTDAAHWPRVGVRLPARISRVDPTVIEIDWEALPSH